MTLYEKFLEAKEAYNQATIQCQNCSLRCEDCPDILDETSSLAIAERRMTEILDAVELAQKAGTDYVNSSRKIK